MIDTHAHLDFPQFDKRINEIIREAQAHGIEKIVTVGIDEPSSIRAKEIALQYEGIVFPTLGLHPHDARALTPQLLDRLESHLKEGGFCAIGETGLDFAKEYSDRSIQQEAFLSQIDLARRFSLPLIVHSRDAFSKTYEILKEEAKGKVDGVLHCFNGDVNQMKKYLDIGFYISFSGIITFKKAEAVRDAVRECPLDRILIETDSPFLAPVPYRGKTNEPAFVRFTAEKAAQVKGISIEEVDLWTTKNAKALFRL